jgi:Ca2+/H+ antiporter
MTAGIALLILGLAMIAIGCRQRLEPAGPALAGAGTGMVILAASLLIATTAAGAETGPPPQSRQFAIVELELLRQAAEVIERQEARIQQLETRVRELLEQSNKREALSCI